MNTILKQTDKTGKVIDVFELGRTLGVGGFAKVYQVVSLQTSQKYALKVVSKMTVIEDNAFDKLALQIKIHKRLKHKHIVRLQRIFEDQENIYLLMELCNNLTLKEVHLKRSRLTEMQVRYYVYQIVSALEYLHINRVIHRDIKLGNIFINDRMQLKLGDFGLSVRLKDLLKRKTTCGTPNYIAPQVLNSKGHSFGVDVWGIGIVAYTLLIGKPPFQKQTVDETYQAIKELKYIFPRSIPISSQAKDFITSILKQDQDQRLKLIQLKQHPFLNRKINMIPQRIPKQYLRQPPSTAFLKQYRSVPNFNIPILPRRLSNFQSVKSNTSSFKSNQKQIKSKLKRSTSFQQLQSLYALQQQKSQPTINKIVSTRNNSKDINSSKTKQNSKFYKSKSRIQRSKTSHNLNKNKEEELQVLKYIDWSDKYGVGYILSNEIVGFIFNDKTSLVKTKNRYLYLDRDNIQFIYSQKQIPISLIKKIKIIKQAESMFKDIKIINPSKQKQIYIKRFLIKDDMIILKSTSNICYFIWKDCKIQLKDYKQVYWKLNDGTKGQGTLLTQFKHRLVNQKIIILKLIITELTHKI